MVSSRAVIYHSLLLLLLKASVAVHQMSVNKNTALSDVMFMESLLFELQTTSKEDCALSCFYTPYCKLFTVTSLPMTCRGHSSVMTSKGQYVSSVGTTTWVPAMFAWLERECSNDTECGVPLSECFAGKCLCSPGYYYSHSTDSCVEECAEGDLHAPFVVYPGYELDGNNLQCRRNFTLESCLHLCAHVPAGRTCDFYTHGLCCLHSLTSRDVPISWKLAATHHQKTCV